MKHVKELIIMSYIRLYIEKQIEKRNRESERKREKDRVGGEGVPDRRLIDL